MSTVPAPGGAAPEAHGPWRSTGPGGPRAVSFPGPPCRGRPWWCPGSITLVCEREQPALGSLNGTKAPEDVRSWVEWTWD